MQRTRKQSALWARDPDTCPIHRYFHHFVCVGVIPIALFGSWLMPAPIVPASIAS